VRVERVGTEKYILLIMKRKFDIGDNIMLVWGLDPLSPYDKKLFLSIGYRKKLSMEERFIRDKLVHQYK
jgi:hypothetical protein